MDFYRKLAEILPRVRNPARYLGGEAGSVHKNLKDLSARMVLAFPDSYEIGMSNNGLKVLYHVVNREKDLLAELAFCPWEDMAEELRKAGLPLYSHSTHSPLADFDILGITLQTELNFTNLPYLLDLAGLPVFQKDRDERHPLVAGGGPSMANPEPVADFFDFFIIGDGELLLPSILRKVGKEKKAGRRHSDILCDLAELEGVYVPSLQAFEKVNGEWLPENPAKGSFLRTKSVRRTWLEELDPELMPVETVVPNAPPVHDRYAVEIMRGCTQGCRFCQAGYWYRPNRELDADAVVDLSRRGIEASGTRQLGLLSLSSADYGPIEKVADILIDDPAFSRVDVSLPSLRANRVGQELAMKVAAVKGGRSATFAPETGSERLRRMINKNISDDEMADAADAVYSSGFNRIKLYTMVGLPTENMEDMEAFCDLISRLAAVGRKYGPGKMLHVSIGIFIPKPFTPMQWVSFIDREKSFEHIAYVRNRFRRDRSVKISWADWETSHLEVFYSRGDRSLAPMIHAAWKKGNIFESFGEKFNYSTWEEVWKDFDYPVAKISTSRNLDAILPWDFIHPGVNKGYLKSEYRKMISEESEPVPDCKWGDCAHCGIPGNYEDIRLSKEPKENVAPSRNLEEIRALMENRRQQEDEIYAYRIVYAKAGFARFLPHQNTMELFERAFVRLGLPLRYSKGFNPKPVIRNFGALPLGLESLAEEVHAEFSVLLDEVNADFLEKLNRIFPEGLRISSVEQLKKRRPGTPLSVDYRCLRVLSADVKKQLEKGVEVENHKGRRFELSREILSLEESPEGFEFRLRCNSSGGSLSPFLVCGALLNLQDEDTRKLPLMKVATSWENV